MGGFVGVGAVEDQAFFVTLDRTAVRFGVPHVLSGVNFASECIVPPNGGFPSMADPAGKQA